GDRVETTRHQPRLVAELPVAERAVGLGRLLEALPQLLAAVVVARLDVEQRLDGLEVQRRLTRELEAADRVARPFVDRDPQPDPPPGSVVRRPDGLDHR